MKIGYSFWGFLGPGVTDTPDGGRSHRRTLIDGLRARGHQVVFLQADRDRVEAGLDLSDTYTWNAGFPDLDALFLEWRWPIPGRNTTACSSPGHTCDLHRQNELLAHYTLLASSLRADIPQSGTPTIVWDKDRTLPASHPLRVAGHVTICEPALSPTPGARTLLFPVADQALDAADPTTLAAAARDLPLAYVGNQYDRDDAFAQFLAPAAAHLSHLVAGKWTRTGDWPHVHFTGRIPFGQVEPTYRRALATVLLLPARYADAGQMTQRLFEAVLAGCLPLTPTAIRHADRFTPPDLHVCDGAEVVSKVQALQAVAGTGRHTDLIAACLRRLDLFRISRQLQVLDQILDPAGSRSTYGGTR